MDIKYAVDENGKWLGVFHGVDMPAGSTEVDTIPAHGRDTWDGLNQRWVPHNDYAAQRAAAYPPVVDQLDALWKGGDAADAMRAKILEVKAKFPKA